MKEPPSNFGLEDFSGSDLESLPLEKVDEERLTSDWMLSSTDIF